MLRRLTCILCPNGCEITVHEKNRMVTAVSGAKCKRGEAYARQEVSDPKRNIASSIKVTNGELPLVSCRLSDVIPKTKIFVVMNEIKQTTVNSPVQIGQVLIKNVSGLGVNVIATKNIEMRKSSMCKDATPIR